MKNKNVIISLLVFILQVFSVSTAQAQLKTDGPYQVSTGEYRFEATVDPEVLKDRETEIWARVFWPKNKVDGTIPTQLPMVALLHGNHGTCGTGIDPRLDDGSEYTDTGECPKGFVVTPNHEGYNYFAEQLASYGYLVISINANRGITAGSGTSGDSGLNLARGRLILRHLALWHRWSTDGGAPNTLESDTNSFIGKVDLSHVGLFGHSRGGEGVRAAYNLYYDLGSFWPGKIPHLKIEAIFEIGAVDGQTNRVLDAQNTVWNQLIPVCDGDVSDFDGIRPFNRMMQSAGQKDSGQKSIYLVYGANHNFFNTEWQDNDSSGCNNHDALWSKKDWKSQRQQDIARKIVPDFFRANLGVTKLKKLNNALNPMNSIEAAIASITHIERDFSPNPNLDTQLRFDDFVTADVTREATTGVTFTTQKGSNSLASALNVSWRKVNPTDEPTIKLHQPAFVDVSNMKTLDFRFSIPGGKVLTAPVNFSVSLVDQAGVESNAIVLTDYVLKAFNPFRTTLYQTVRVPMDKFTGINLSQLKTVQFKMIAPDAGNVYFAHVRFSSIVSELMSFDEVQTAISLASNYKINSNNNFLEEINRLVSHATELNQIVQVKIIPAQNFLESQVAVTFASQIPFKIRNALPVLKVGESSFRISQIKNVDGMSRITFYLTLSDLELIKKTQGDIRITYKGNSMEEWIFTNTIKQ
jgi:hypothetical protein